MAELINEFRAIYTIWLREVIRFNRARSRIISSVVTPLIWLLIFGTGMGASFGLTFRNVSYSAFLFPGIIGMAILFSSTFGGLSIIFDKQFGFFKEILVAPISRPSIVIGKALGTSTTSVIQGILILIFSFIIGVTLTPMSVLTALIIMFLMAMGLVSVGITIASVMESHEGFQMIMNFLIMPMFFLSGALFPLSGLPSWLGYSVLLNPLTYSVDALRFTLIGVSEFPIFLDLVAVCAFDIGMIIIGGYIFSRRN